MKMKKLVSAIAALAISVSAFAGLTAQAATNTVYSKALTEWAEADLTEWVSTFDKSYKPTYTADTTNGLYVGTVVRDAKVTKTIAPTANSTLTINAVFGVGETTGKAGNYSYLNIGDNISFRAYGQDQKAVLNAGGVDYSMGGNFASKGNNNRGGDTWNISMVVDTATKVITSVTVTGTTGNTPGSYTAANIACDSGALFTTLEMGHVRKGGTIGGTSLKSISIVEETKEVAMADYTINYTIDGEPVEALTESASNAVGTVITAESVLNVEGVRYYILADEAPSMTLVDGENVLNVPVRIADNYAVNVATSTGLAIASGTVVEGDGFTYSNSMYLTDENGKVTAKADENNFTTTVVPTADENIVIPYTAYDGDAWFTEGRIGNTDQPVDGRLSGGHATRGLADGASVEVMTVAEDGIYSVTTCAVTNNAGKGNMLYVYKNSVEEANLIDTLDINSSTVNYINTSTKTEVVLNAGDTIVISVNATSSSLDYVLIEKTGEYVAPSIDSAVEVVSAYEDGATAEDGATIVGTATALTATFTISGDTSFNHVAFTVSGVTAEGDVTTVSGDGAQAVYGIVVNGAVITADQLTATASLVEAAE